MRSHDLERIDFADVDPDGIVFGARQEHALELRAEDDFLPISYQLKTSPDIGLTSESRESQRPVAYS